MESARLFKIEELKDFCAGILRRVGVSSDNAGIIADSLVCADLRGIKSHGVVRLPTYVERVETGVMSLADDMEFIKRSSAAAVLDAKNGFGQIAGYKAMQAAIDMASSAGVAMVGVKNSNHFGIASYYSMLALEADMIGIVLTNASPAIAPYGTATPLFGTNPLSIAVPASKEKPIVLDMAMSTVARGKIRYAALKGEGIPEGWGLDARGMPTTDPNEVLKGGSLVPIGGVKGSGLALIVDIMCGILTDTCLTGEVKNITDMSGPAKTGHLFCAVNIANFVDVGVFKQNIDKVIQRIKTAKAVGDNPIYLPGEIEHDLERKRMVEGIPIEVRVVELLNNLALRYNAPTL